MAQPLRKDDDLGNRTPQPELRIYQGSSHRSRNWLWLLIIIVIAGLAIWGISRSHPKPVPQPVATPGAASPATNPPVDVPTLLTNKDTYFGKPVHLRDVLVQNVNGESSIFVGPSSDQQLLVILKPGAIPDSLQGKVRSIPKGGIVTISGTAEKAGSAADLERSARITRKEAEQVVRRGVVIQADRAEPQTM